MRAKRAIIGLFALVLGALFALVPFEKRTSAASNPPIGSTWKLNKSFKVGENGELNVTWSVTVESANTQFVSLRYTFLGEVGFITDQPCNNPTAIPLPWNRLSLTARLSGGGTAPPAVFNDESLATAKLDYQTPTFVNCWLNENPPLSYPTAVSYVRYSGYRFSAIQTAIPTGFFSSWSAVQLTASADDLGSNFLGHSIPIPVIAVDLESTTTKPQTSTTSKSQTTTTRAGESSTTVKGSVVGTTTSTILGEDVGTTIPTETVPPDLGAGPDESGNATSDEVVGVPYDLETETPEQEEKRKEDTASSLAVTAAVLISSLAAAAPALGAVSAAGAVGGVMGITTARSFSGGQILPQVPSPSEATVEKSKSSNPRKLKDPPDQTSATDVVLENSFTTPNTVSTAKGATRGVSLAHVGRLFAFVISGLQNLSRLHMFRPGLRRWAEVALVNPVLAAMLPLAIFSCSALLAALATDGLMRSTVTMLCLFGLSILAPVFSLFTVIGWCVGRMLFSSGTVAMSVSEAVALLPGLLFLPMMLRNLIGPRMRSHSWERILALLLAPIVATFAYRNWILHYSGVADSLSKKFSSTLSLDVGVHVLGSTSELIALALGLFMAVSVMSVAAVALRFADDQGQPELMFRRFVREENPTQVLRRAYVDLATVELGEPARWARWMRYGIAGLLSTYLLSEVLGMESIILVVVFLIGVALAKKSQRTLFKNEVHPIVKTIPMVGIGLVLGTISVSPNRVFFSFAIVALLAVLSSVVRTRSLWDA